jgi:rubrerythrin
MGRALSRGGRPDTRPASRGDVIRWAALGGGALALGGLGSQEAAAAPSPAQDARVLSLVLLLEYTEAAFYREAVAHGALRGEVLEYAKVVGEHERAHVEFLKKALGTAAPKEPRHRFGRSTRDSQAFVSAAIALEEAAVATYDGQATNLTPKTLAAAAKIASVEARHAAWIRSIADLPPAPDAVDSRISEAETRTALRSAGLQIGAP